MIVINCGTLRQPLANLLRLKKYQIIDLPGVSDINRVNTYIQMTKSKFIVYTSGDNAHLTISYLNTFFGKTVPNLHLGNIMEAAPKPTIDANFSRPLLVMNPSNLDIQTVNHYIDSLHLEDVNRMEDYLLQK